MNENLNLVEILKDVPQGTKLYSPLFGEVGFDGIDKEDTRYPIKVDTGLEINEFTADGRFDRLYNGEVMLFPSKEQRDWSKFNVPKVKVRLTLYPFDRVLVRDTAGEWSAEIFSHYIDEEPHFTTSAGIYDECIPYNEMTAHLLGTTDECPIEFNLDFTKEFRHL